MYSRNLITTLSTYMKLRICLFILRQVTGRASVYKENGKLNMRKKNFRGFYNPSWWKLHHFVSSKLTANQKEFPTIRSSVFAKKYCQKLVGHHDPCNSELFNYVLEGIKTTCCHTPKKKKPFTPQLLHTSYRSLGKDNKNLINLRTMLLCVLSFMGMLSFCEVIKLKNSNIILKETHMSIFIEKSKTDVYREGY